MIDEDHLARQTAGDTELRQELLALLLAQLTDLQGQIGVAEQAGAGGSLLDLPPMLHRVRGAAAAVGAGELAHRLDEVERGLAQNPSSPSVLGVLRTELGAATVALRGLIEARGGPGLAKAGESR